MKLYEVYAQTTVSNKSATALNETLLYYTEGFLHTISTDNFNRRFILFFVRNEI